MFFNTSETEPLYVSRSDDSSPLSSFSRHGFCLDDAEWHTVEHYFQGMKFTDPGQRAAIRNMASPTEAQQLAEKHVRAVRKDWKKIRQQKPKAGQSAIYYNIFLLQEYWRHLRAWRFLCLILQF